MSKGTEAARWADPANVTFPDWNVLLKVSTMV